MWRALTVIVPVLCLTGPAAAQSLEELEKAAKAEGQLTVISLPHDWCNYGEQIEGFKAKYGIAINELNPNAVSGDSIEAIRASKGNSGPQAPDVVELGPSFSVSAKAEGLLQPYKVSTWDSIPDVVKDADGYWYGDYFGLMSFEINGDLVKRLPEDWPDLLAPEYKDSVALSGDPRIAFNGVQAVYAAGLSATGGDAAKAAEAGLAYFAALNQAGNLVPVNGRSASLAQGTTPIILRWDFVAMADRDTLQGNPPVEIVVPKTGVIANYFTQAISAYAPHPNAAKLWMEYLYSDEGQLRWLAAYCRPVRFDDLDRHNKIPAELKAKLPPAERYANAVFPTLDEQNAAKEVISSQWEKIVKLQVK
jgi:putative spermidine/putrescine transport system substrate-binding protein